MRTKLVSNKNGSRVASWSTDFDDSNMVDGKVYPSGRRASGFRTATLQPDNVTVHFASAFGTDLPQYARNTYKTNDEAVNGALGYVRSVVLVLSKNTLLNSTEVDY